MLPAFSRTTKQKLFLEPHESVVWMNVLRCVSGYQAYRQRTHSQVKGEDVVKFLLQDDAFPRSLGYCLYDLVQHLQKLPNNVEVVRAVARAKKITTDVNISHLLQHGGVVGRTLLACETKRSGLNLGVGSDEANGAVHAVHLVIAH